MNSRFKTKGSSISHLATDHDGPGDARGTRISLDAVVECNDVEAV